MNTPVSIELERLLLEKNIDAPVKTTIADVVMWLYDNHGIWIYTSKPDEKGWVIHWQGFSNYPALQYYNSPKEAYEAAIEFYLTNKKK